MASLDLVVICSTNRKSFEPNLHTDGLIASICYAHRFVSIN